MDLSVISNEADEEEIAIRDDHFNKLILGNGTVNLSDPYEIKKDNLEHQITYQIQYVPMSGNT